MQRKTGLDHELAVSLVKGVITTLDQSPLRPHIDAMMTEGYKEALAISAISGDAPDDFGLFLAMCEKNEILSDDEAFEFSNMYVDAERANNAV